MKAVLPELWSFPSKDRLRMLLAAWNRVGNHWSVVLIQVVLTLSVGIAVCLLPWFGVPIGHRGVIRGIMLLAFLGCIGFTPLIRRSTMRSFLRSELVARGICTSCGYNLTDNISGVCPECGERI